MAKESALWQRVKGAGQHLTRCGYHVHLERIENDAGSGHPDVDACLDGALFKLELKQGARPVRESSKVQIKSNKNTKAAQDIWHTKRHRAGSRHHWVLVQVGDAHEARLYLIPGYRYIEIYGVTETALRTMSWVKPDAEMASVLLTAIEGYTV